MSNPVTDDQLLLITAINRIRAGLWSRPEQVTEQGPVFDSIRRLLAECRIEIVDDPFGEAMDGE